MFESSLSHSFLLPQRQLRLRWHSPCSRRLQQEAADRKPGGCERPRVHNPRAVVTGFKIYMRCARRTVPLGPKLALAELKQFIQVSLTLQVNDRRHGTRWFCDPFHSNSVKTVSLKPRLILAWPELALPGLLHVALGTNHLPEDAVPPIGAVGNDESSLVWKV